MKLRKYCKKCVIRNDPMLARGSRKAKLEVNIVSGESWLSGLEFAAFERRDLFDRCGPEARYFTPTLKYKVLKFMGAFNG